MTTFKPHWQTKHDWWIDDFKFEIDQKEVLCGLLMKHPEDDIGECFRDMIEAIDKRIRGLKRDYKAIYGRTFNINRVYR